MKQSKAKVGRIPLGTVKEATRGAGTKTFEVIGLRDNGFDL